MSKITLTPNDQGTGTFTIASPNSNTNRTLTLPDSAGELLTTTGDGSNLTGIIAADDSVNEAKLQVSNAPVNGYALTAQSGNTGGMTWAEMAAGGTTLISTTTISSAVATVDIALPTGYGDFELFLEGVKPSSTASSTLRLRVSTDNGSTFLAGTNYIAGNALREDIALCGTNNFNNQTFAVITIQGAKDSSVVTAVSSYISSLKQTDITGRGPEIFGGQFKDTTVVTNIRLLATAAAHNFVSGKLRLYGRAV